MKNIPVSAIAILLATLLVAASSPSASGAVDAEGYVEIEENAPELLRILESLPYAAEGEGPVVYMFEFSECPYCQTKYRDFRGQDLGMEFRRFFVPVTDRSARETAALGKSRDPQDYHAYMTGRKAAPAIDYDNEAIEIHNTMITAASEAIPPILIRNGWNARGLVFPAYFWFEGGRLFAQGGYLKDNFERAMDRAREGWTADSVALLASVGGAPDGDSKTMTASVSTDEGRSPDSKGFDIVGLQLGMTRQAIISTIQNHNPKLRITEVTNPVIMRDSRMVGVEMFDFISEVVADWAPGTPGHQAGSENHETIRVAFTGPPSDSRAIYIARDLLYMPEQAPAFEVVANALVEKYGQPAYRANPSSTNTKGFLMALWRQETDPIPETALSTHMMHLNQGVTIKNHGGTYRHAPTQIKGLPQPQPEVGPSVYAMVNTRGPRVNTLYTALCEDPQVIRTAKMATADLANAALARHEEELLDSARQQKAPKL
ncbi:MAG: hypothetical protein R3F07_17320 [Opitutaceae bacterium]